MKTQELLNTIGEIIKKYEKISELTGEKFNIFKILDIETKEEKTHSAFIAELLNPKGSHGKKDVFLKLFFQECIQPKFEFNTENAKVTVEKNTGRINEDYNEGGRIDIIIESEGKAIIIENKIYAVDQENQLLRYHNYGEANFKKGFSLIYLTLWGYEASLFSLGDKGIGYAKLSYKEEILKWLQLCHKEAFDNPMLREVIKQYINLVKKLTNQTTNIKMEEEIITQIVKNKANFNAAFDIHDSLAKAKESIKNKFLTLANGQLNANNPFYSKNGIDIHFKIEHDSPDGIFYGFIATLNGK